MFNTQLVSNPGKREEFSCIILSFYFIFRRLVNYMDINCQFFLLRFSFFDIFSCWDRHLFVYLLIKFLYNIKYSIYSLQNLYMNSHLILSRKLHKFQIQLNIQNNIRLHFHIYFDRIIVTWIKLQLKEILLPFGFQSTSQW